MESARLAEAGATAAASPAAIAQSDAELIISMLPAAAHMKSLYLGNNGLLAHVQPEALLINCSIIDQLSAHEVTKAAAEHGNPMLDAPVSGGTGGATAGTLTFMVGGLLADFDRAQGRRLTTNWDSSQLTTSRLAVPYAI